MTEGLICNTRYLVNFGHNDKYMHNEFKVSPIIMKMKSFLLLNTARVKDTLIKFKFEHSCKRYTGFKAGRGTPCFI